VRINLILSINWGVCLCGETMFCQWIIWHSYRVSINRRVRECDMCCLFVLIWPLNWLFSWPVVYIVRICDSTLYLCFGLTRYRLNDNYLHIIWLYAYYCLIHLIISNLGIYCFLDRQYQDRLNFSKIWLVYYTD